MKKFRFRLERILQLKAHIEKERQKLLGIAAKKTAEQEYALRGIEHDRLENQQRERKFLTGRISTGLLSTFSRYFIHLKKSELTGREVLRALKEEREKKRLDLVRATRDKKMYEKLREKRFETFKENYERVTQKEQDELAGQIYHYKKSSRADRELPDDRK